MWAAFFGSLIVLAVVALVTFEYLVYRLYVYHPLDWARARAPYGFGQPGIQLGLARGYVWRHRLQKQFFFRLPEWIRNDNIGFAVLIVYKISTVLFVTGVIGFLVIALLLS